MDLRGIKSELEKRGKLILFLVSAVGFLGSFLFFLTGLMGQKQPPPVRDKSKDVDINFEIFEKEEFKNLKAFEGSKKPEDQGREEPFEPYVLEEVEEEEETPEEETPEEEVPEEEVPEEEAI